MSKSDSFPGITAEQLAEQMTTAGAGLYNDFLHAVGRAAAPAVYEGKPLGLLEYRCQLIADPSSNDKGAEWTERRPDWPKNKKGMPFPYMPSQELVVSVSESDSYNPDESGLHPAKQPCSRGVAAVIPPSEFSVLFSGFSSTRGTYFSAANFPNVAHGGNYGYSQKYFMAAGVELAKLCLGLPNAYEDVVESQVLESGTSTMGNARCVVSRAVLPILGCSTPLNGNEGQLDEAVQLGMYGSYAQQTGSFFAAYEAIALAALATNGELLTKMQELRTPNILISNTIARLETAQNALDNVQKYLR